MAAQDGRSLEKGRCTYTLIQQQEAQKSCHNKKLVAAAKERTEKENPGKECRAALG